MVGDAIAQRPGLTSEFGAWPWDRGATRLNIDEYGNYFERQTHGVPTSNGLTMIVLGIILLLIGYFAGISILYTIGGILLVIGIIMWILGAVGRPVGGRKVWF